MNCKYANMSISSQFTASSKFIIIHFYTIMNLKIENLKTYNFAYLEKKPIFFWAKSAYLMFY